jgi:phenylacetate-coenzyme A ligase PaaK-like adenylate-forming protein
MTQPTVEERLRKLANETVDRYPFYHKWKNQHVRFEDLPLLDKWIVNEHRDQLRLPRPGHVLESFTSGSTGVPFLCEKTPEEQMKLSMAIHRHRRKWGLPLKHRSVLLGDTLFGQPRMVPHYANQIVNSSPHMIQGRCSALFLMAEYFASRKQLSIPDTLLFVQNWGEAIQPAQRTIIEEVFGVPVLDYYGMEEIWIIAFSNKQGLLEVDEQLVYVEVTDPANGWPMPEGEIGDIVVTSFIMKSMPFVRYRTGDMGRIYGDRTTGKTKIELLPFRSTQIKLPDRTVNASIFRYLDRFYRQLSIEMGVKQFQMIQETYTSFRLRIVANMINEMKMAVAAKQLETLLKQALFTENLTIAIESVSRIAPHPVSGKFQPFVSFVS